MNRHSKPIPEALLPLQQQFEQFRATHPPRSRPPEAFWSSAAELARGELSSSRVNRSGA
jgi:hypothetical protein